MQSSEQNRNRWAVGLTIFCSALIFIGFAFYRGFLSFGEGMIAGEENKNQTANVISAEAVPSPLENSKEAFSAAFKEIGGQYQKFKDSMADVLVPFVTSINVYERE